MLLLDLYVCCSRGSFPAYVPTVRNFHTISTSLANIANPQRKKQKHSTSVAQHQNEILYAVELQGQWFPLLLQLLLSCSVATTVALLFCIGRVQAYPSPFPMTCSNEQYSETSPAANISTAQALTSAKTPLDATVGGTIAAAIAAVPLFWLRLLSLLLLLYSYVFQ